MTWRLKLMALGFLGVAAVSLYFVWQHKERQIGYERAEKENAQALAVQRAREAEDAKHDKQVSEDAVNAMQAERDRLAAALAATPAPVLRLCQPARSSGGLPATPGVAGTSSQGAATGGDVSGVSTGVVAGPDIGSQLRDLAVVAEQLAAQDRALLQRERGLH